MDECRSIDAANMLLHSQATVSGHGIGHSPKAVGRRNLTCGFVGTDYAGRIIELEHSNWEKHVPRHPEFVQFHDEIEVTVREPDVVTEPDETQRHYYRRGHWLVTPRELYIRVVVGTSNGKIRTAHFIRSIDTHARIVYLRETGSEHGNE